MELVLVTLLTKLAVANTYLETQKNRKKIDSHRTDFLKLDFSILVC